MPKFSHLLLLGLAGWLFSALICWWLMENEFTLLEQSILIGLPWAITLAGLAMGFQRTKMDQTSLSPLQWARRMDARSYNAQDLLIREGDAADGLYILSSGRVQVWKTDEYGARLDIAELVPGSIFGEMGLLRSQPRNANVEALEPTTALFVKRELFSEIVQSSKETHKSLETLASERTGP